MLLSILFHLNIRFLYGFPKNLKSPELRKRVSKFLGNLPSEQIFYRNVPLGALESFSIFTHCDERVLGTVCQHSRDILCVPVQNLYVRSPLLQFPHLLIFTIWLKAGLVMCIVLYPDIAQITICFAISRSLDCHTSSSMCHNTWSWCTQGQIPHDLTPQYFEKWTGLRTRWYRSYHESLRRICSYQHNISAALLSVRYPSNKAFIHFYLRKGEEARTSSCDMRNTCYLLTRNQSHSQSLRFP